MNAPEPGSTDAFADNVPLAMQRLTLDDIPAHGLPDGYALRYYRDGDEATWTALQRATEKLCEIEDGTFRKQFGTDETLIAQRMMFIDDADGRTIATTSAWYDDRDGRDEFGRVHWVAVHPDAQGRGLSKPLLSAVLLRMKDLGHSAVYLHTSAGRIAALNLYLAYGFDPWLCQPEHRAQWASLRERVKYPIKLD